MWASGVLLKNNWAPRSLIEMIKSIIVCNLAVTGMINTALGGRKDEQTLRHSDVVGKGKVSL